VVGYPPVKPLLLLDVDGVLNPGASRNQVDKDRLAHRYYVRHFKGYRVFLSPEHGPMLTEFCERQGLELVWATTWEHDANSLIGPVVGLPRLPVIEFGGNCEHWKFDAVAEYADGRPLAWLDDDLRLYPKHRGWFEEQRGDTPTLLHTVAGMQGLVADDLATVAAWQLEEFKKLLGRSSLGSPEARYLRSLATEADMVRVRSVYPPVSEPHPENREPSSPQPKTHKND
jgi:hypothetical protein